MLTARRYGFFENYLITDGDKKVAEVKSRWFKPLVVIGDQQYDLVNKFVSDKLYVALLSGGREVIKAEAKSSFSGIREIEFIFENTKYSIKWDPRGRSELMKAGQPLGEISLKRPISRTIEIKLPGSEPLIIQVFLLLLFRGWV